MSARTLQFASAAQAILDADPLSDVRISLGWRTVSGQRLPVLRISTRSTVYHRQPAKALGSLYGASDDEHFGMLEALANACASERQRRAGGRL